VRRDLVELVEAADLNGLLRAVDGLCQAREWEELFDLADACEDALERGKQLWPISDHIDYRIALEAPGEYAAQVVTPAARRFAHGPLTEVAASSHKWAELADHLDSPQTAAYVAQERVLRGEVLEGDERAHPSVLDLPLRLEPFEPTYTLAIFRSDHVEVPEPWDPIAPLVEAQGSAAAEIEDEDLSSTLLDLVSPWTTESNGAARVVVVEGGASAAASLVAGADLRIGPLEPEEALQRMAWAAAAGGAHGRRRGAAFGRSMAWYVTGVAAGLSWPIEPAALERALHQLSWYRWDEGEPERGWVLRLAVEDRSAGWAAAIGATDVLEDDDEEPV
jgi:Family of unknown function (DUF6183)